MIKRTPQEIADFFGCYVARDEGCAGFDMYTDQPVINHKEYWWDNNGADVGHLPFSAVPEEFSDKDWRVLYSSNSGTNQQADEGISPERGDAGSYFRNSMHPDNKVESYYADRPDSDNKHQYEVHTDKEYRIVTAHKEIDPESFAKGVMAWVERGWVPAGGISFDKQGRPYQAMVRGV